MTRALRDVRSQCLENLHARSWKRRQNNASLLEFHGHMTLRVLRVALLAMAIAGCAARGNKLASPILLFA